MSFQTDISGFVRGTAEAELRAKAALALYAGTAGQKLEAKAKTDATWQDRTGKARQTITGGYEWIGNKCRIYVTGHMSYSPYLEFCYEKNYAVLWPTVDSMKVEILEGLTRLL